MRQILRGWDFFKKGQMNGKRTVKGPLSQAQDWAEALGRTAEPRDGVGDQIRYLGLRVAPSAAHVNVPKAYF